MIANIHEVMDYYFPEIIKNDESNLITLNSILRRGLYSFSIEESINLIIQRDSNIAFEYIFTNGYSLHVDKERLTHNVLKVKSLKILNFLIKNNSIATRYDKEKSPISSILKLYFSIWLGNRETAFNIMKVFISYGYDINEVSSDGTTPFYTFLHYYFTTNDHDTLSTTMLEYFKENDVKFYLCPKDKIEEYEKTLQRHGIIDIPLILMKLQEENVDDYSIL